MLHGWFLEDKDREPDNVNAQVIRTTSEHAVESWMMPDPRILAELFTSTHLQQLAWYGWSETLSASVRILEKEGRISHRSPVADVLDDALSVLVRDHPIEYVYKACVLKRTVFGTYSPNTTALYMEFPVANARADILLVNGEASVFEVKTRFDDAKRLNIQLSEYYRCFQCVSVVVEEDQFERYTQELPEHVGVSALTPRFSIGVRRSPTATSGRLDHAQMFALLRQRECCDAIADLGVDLSSVDPSVRYQTALQYFSTLPVRTAYERVLRALRIRQRTKCLAQLCRRLPDSLHASVFSYRLRKQDWENLIGVLSRPPVIATERIANVFPIPQG